MHNHEIKLKVNKIVIRIVISVYQKSAQRIYDK